MNQYADPCGGCYDWSISWPPLVAAARSVVVHVDAGYRSVRPPCERYRGGPAASRAVYRYVVVVAAAAPRGWKAYDAVADVYDDVAAPLFRRLAQDLIAFVTAAPGCRVLDLGTGTGFAAEVASAVVAEEGMVVGVDPSLPMLRIAHRRVARLVMGLAPGLCFRAGCFDVVVASLVLSHLPDPDRALRDVARVLRPGGTLGASAWAEADVPADDDGVVAGSIVTAALERFGLPTELPTPGAPSERPLMIESNLRSALREAGFVDVAIEERVYATETAVDRYVREHDWWGRGRYLRSVTDDETMARFHREVTDQLMTRFPDGIRRTHLLRLAAGTSPA